MPASHLSAIILAAGTSSRMGSRNKLLLPLAGKPLVAHVLEATCASAADATVVVLGHEANAVRAALADIAAQFVTNLRYADGMTTSIQAGVAAAPTETQGFLILLGDQALLTAADLDALIHTFRGALAVNPNAILVPEHHGQRGHPVIFAAAHRDVILAHDEPGGLRGVVEANRGHVVPHPVPTDHVCVDADTPAAYEALVARVG